MDLSSIAKLLISSVYYIIVGLLALFSAFGVYILLRYGRTIPLTVLISIIYAIFFLTAVAASYNALLAIQKL